MRKHRYFRFVLLALSLVLVLANGGLALAATAVTVSKIVLNVSELTLAIEDTSALTATAVYSDSTSGDVTVNSDWSSDKPAVATVYNGMVTAKGEGTATIVAVFTYSDGTKFSQAATVTVTKKVKALTQNIQNLDLRKAESGSIILTATYSDNTTDATVASKAVWSTSDAAVATVVNGVVKGISSGTATITGVYGKKTITVTASVEVAKRIEADQPELALLLKDSAAVKLTATFQDGTQENVTALAAWSSSDESVADVLKGVITGYKQGTAVVTAKYGTKTTAIQVSVDQTSKLAVDDQNVFLKTEEDQQLKLTAVYPDGTVKDVTSTAVWSSSDSGIAYVYKGRIYGNAAGTATITGTYGDKSVEVAVDVAVARYLDLSEEQLSLKTSSSHALTLTATYADGTTEDVTAKAVWSSSNELVAFVKKGAVTTYKSAGTATISAAYGTLETSLEVEVGTVSKLTASSDSVFLQSGGTKQLTLTAVAGDGSSSDVTASAAWASSDKSIALASKGLITGYTIGTATITATYNGASAAITVDVGTARHLALSETKLNLAVDADKALTLSATFADGTVTDVTSKAAWTSSDEAVAFADKGKITTYSEGNVTITAEYGGKKVTAAAAVGKSNKLSADSESINLRLNATRQLVLTALDANGTPSTVTDSAVWTAADENIATVTKGLVTGYKSGATTITAVYGGKTITVAVSVETAARLNLTVSKLNLGKDQSKAVTVMASYADGTSQDVTGDAVWSTDNAAVADVSKGTITAYATGSAVITASYGGKTAAVKVTAGTPDKLTLSAKAVELKEDETYQAVATGSYSDGSDLTVTDEAEWSSSDEKVAEVKDGLITGTGTGTAVITAKLGSVKATITVECGLVDELAADVSLVVLSAGDKGQITLTATDSAGEESDVTADADWSSAKTTVATVKKGLVTGVLKGKTTVTASYGGQKVSISIEVDQIAEITASVTNLAMKSGDSGKVTVSIAFSDGSTRDVTDKAEWKSGSYKIATVTGGTVKAVAYGKSYVTAKYGGKTVKIPVTVDVLKYLEVSQMNLTLSVGQSVQLAATATFEDGSESDVSRAATWTSSKELVATGKNGLIKASSKGSASISVKYGGKTVKIKVTVK
ncbi:Ig-like domain-containing protein [Paenibacillus sp. MMS20-IR301]|uniref:Ig-like domain-containing protein n=1 Tax=Paenibacillus sp. MMS20-IR301 TaxID=2895946 RepID=UPI0028E38461|nr:Ig-like domain-containing protein [Paenibacillus sp. MMS20-IR301]WNS41137.1 Ig-like domain-containing protein [Paenibacillus sp. MMS20-IR301]